MAVLIYSNIGGGLTLVGDPPNVIIATNAKIVAAVSDFITYINFSNRKIPFVNICKF